MIKTDSQKIADFFSIGTIVSSKPVEDPLKIKTVRKNPLTKKDEALTGRLSLFHLQTNRGRYILVGITPNTLNQYDLKKRLRERFRLTRFEFLGSHKDIPLTHKNDLHWYLFQPFKILNREKAIGKIAKLIRNQEIRIQIGYGGVLFIELGKPLKPKVAWASDELYREMEFFVDEKWEIWDKDKKVASRFEDEAADKYVDKINGKIVTDFNVQPSCKKTFITLGNYSLVIYQTEELTTWDFSHRVQNFRITLTGRKQFRINDYLFERPEQTTKKHRSFQLTVFDQFYKENTPISHGNVRKLIEPMIGSIVKEVMENTGIAFCLLLKNSDSWLLGVNIDWELHRKNKPILSSRSHRFAYAQQLTKYLLSKKLTSLHFSKSLDETILTFDDDLRLIVRMGKKPQLWTIFNQDKDYHLNALNTGKFEHIIICPGHLRKQYLEPQYGEKFASSLYALDLYRDLISKE